MGIEVEFFEVRMLCFFYAQGHNTIPVLLYIDFIDDDIGDHIYTEMWSLPSKIKGEKKTETKFEW